MSNPRHCGARRAAYRARADDDCHRFRLRRCAPMAHRSGGGGRPMSGSPAHHNLFSYDDDGALVDRVAPFLAGGLGEREAVVLVVDARKRALLVDALGELAGRVAYIDRDSYYTRPEDALAGYDAQVRQYVKQGFPR